MKVKACMTKNVISVGVDEPVAEAARLMSRYNLGSLPVCTAQGRLCGMLTDRDVVLRCVAAGKATDRVAVREVMSTGVVCVDAAEDTEQALRLMSRAQLRRLPVTSGSRLCGMLSLGDLARNGSFSAQTAQCMEAICAPVVRLD